MAPQGSECFHELRSPRTTDPECKVSQSPQMRGIMPAVQFIFAPKVRRRAENDAERIPFRSASSVGHLNWDTSTEYGVVGCLTATATWSIRQTGLEMCAQKTVAHQQDDSRWPSSGKLAQQPFQTQHQHQLGAARRNTLSRWCRPGWIPRQSAYGAYSEAQQGEGHLERAQGSNAAT